MKAVTTEKCFKGKYVVWYAVAKRCVLNGRDRGCMIANVLMPAIRFVKGEIIFCTGNDLKAALRNPSFGLFPFYLYSSVSL